MIINLHFTSRKIWTKKKTDKQNCTIARYQYTESTWEYNITNSNNKYICKKENCLL